MKLRPLVLDNNAKQLVAAVVAYAELNRIPLGMMKQLAANSGQVAVGDNPNRCCIIPFGYRCAFSIEEQPAGWCRHISISVDGNGVAPNEIAVQELIKLFGFGDIRKAYCFTESIPGGNKVAINVIERI